MLMISRKKQWRDLTLEQRVAIVLLSLVQVALLAAALLDLYRRPQEQINGKKGWWVLVSFINYIGPIAYFSFGRK